MLSLIVAMGANNVIGYENDMPWHLPRDLKFFKETTTGHTIIMGRKTFDSIGRPLPNRKNVVLTRQENDFPNEVEVIHNLETVFNWNQKYPEEEFIIIGGGELYKQVLPYVDRMYITKINENFKGDTYFPKIQENDWIITNKEKGIKDEKNPYDYYFLQYDRKK